MNMADKWELSTILRNLSTDAAKIRLTPEAQAAVQDLQDPKYGDPKNGDPEKVFNGLTMLCGEKNMPDEYKRRFQGLKAKLTPVKGIQSMMDKPSGNKYEQLPGNQTMVPGGRGPITSNKFTQREFDTAEATGIAPGSSQASSNKELSQLQQKMQKLEAKLKDSEGIADKREMELKEKEQEARHMDARYNTLQHEHEELKRSNQKLERDGNEYYFKKEECEKVIETQNRKLESFDKAINELQSHLEKTKKVSREKFDMYEIRLKSMDEHCSTLSKEKDDLRDRFSKLAGHKLTDKNADIADLSDANRPLKISEKMGSVYDDEWTDAFQELTEKVKMQRQESIHFLLDCLKDCFQLCEKVAEQQIDSLKNVILFPAQDTHFVQESKGRIGSKDEQALRDVRRQIGSQHGAVVKQIFFKSLNKERAFEKQISLVKPYLEKLADVCWLMAICDPPMFMDMTVKRGSKFDSNMYTHHTSSGKTVEYLVWPPLYNCKNGGLITKGVVATERVVSKK